MKLKLLASFLVACTVLFSSAPAMAMASPAMGGFDTVVTFGDSISDNGPTSATDYYGFKPFTLGKSWTDQLAAHHGASAFNVAFGGALSGVGNVYPTYNDPAAKNYNPETDPFWDVVFPSPETVSENTTTWTGLNWQVNYAPIKAQIAPMEKDRTLFTVWAGANDYNGLMAYAGLLGRAPTTIELQGVASLAAGNILNALGELKAQGAKHIVVPNLMKLGDGTFSDVFNFQLASGLLAFENSFDGRIYNLDIYSLFDRLFGSEYTGTDEERASAIAAGLLWAEDGYHPGPTMHAAMASAAYYESITPDPVPAPASLMLMASGLFALVGINRRRSA